MSISNLRWIKGAPETLKVGMVIRVPIFGGTTVVLIGTYTPSVTTETLLLSCIEWAQAIADFEISWLDNMGVPAKLVKP